MKTVWVVLLTVIIAGGLAGGGTYAYYNSKATTDKNNLQSQINTLNNQITSLNSQLSTAKSATTSKTADWKTYTNTTEGYSIKYPTGWTLSNNDATNVGIWPSVADNYIFNVTVISSQSTLTDYINGLKTEATNEINNGQPGNTFGTQSQTTIGGQPAVKFINCTEGVSGYKFDWYFVKNGSNIYKIEITKAIGQGPVVDVNQYIPTAETMLSTFLFTK